MADFPYQVDHDLAIVPVTLFGKSQKTYNASFVLDTGASGVIIDHSLAEALGYSARDGIGRSTVSSAVGREWGYRLMIEGIEALGKKFSPMDVLCHDLIEQGIEGLLGMTFLKRFDWCVFPNKQIISVKPI